MLKKLYKTKEFAELCDVSKHTLFYYDEIGLLCPKIRKENGYRYYTAEQFDTFNIINTMKKIGVSLEDIKNYLSIHNKDMFINVLKEKQKDLRKEIESLKSIDDILSENIQLLKEDLSSKINKIYIEECREEYLIATPTLKTKEIDEKIVSDTLSRHFKFCRENSLKTGLHVGEIVLKKDIINEEFLPSYCYSKIKEKIVNERLIIKPKGTYAVFYYQGNYNMLSKGYRKLYEKVKEMGYIIAGDMYAEDIVDYFSENDPEKFILKLSMKIEKE